MPDRSSSPRLRLFVALDLPVPVRERLARWQEAELGDPALRRARPEALHLTLAFLGHLPEPRIAEIVAAMRALEAAAPELRLDPIPVALPKRRPRLYAIAAPSPEATAIQAGLSERLQAADLYTPEKRPFWPHLTVARVRADRGGSRRPARVATPPAALPEALLEPFRSVRLALYRSQLRPSGAEYVTLANVELPSPGG